MSETNLIRKFNNSEYFLAGWYWALPSAVLKKNQPEALNFLGKEMVIYRGADGKVRAMDAYCPHMGAHLAEGKIEGNSLRCMFHGWKFDENGTCSDIPCLSKVIAVDTLNTYETAEHYGMIWIWTGTGPSSKLPEVPELDGKSSAVLLGNSFVKNCHPNVVMINAIDAQHFNTVHPMVKNLAGGVNLEAEKKDEHSIEFRNLSMIQNNGSLLNKLLAPFYSGALTYHLKYWYGSTGTVTIGPDFLRFHIMFTLRPTAKGEAEGQTILVTRTRSGIFGKALNAVLLRVTKIVGDYFAKGDTQIFRTIRFSLHTPIAADTPIIKFIKHAERQELAAWSFSQGSGACQ